MSERPDKSTTTSGSDERSGRSLSAPLSGFSLPDEVARLRGERPYEEGDRNARTLVKEGQFRLTLVAFRAGATFDENDQRGSVAIHVLEGRLSVRAADQSLELAGGDVAAIAPHQPWGATASEDGVLLLHLAWPPEPDSRPAGA